MININAATVTYISAINAFFDALGNDTYKEQYRETQMIQKKRQGNLDEAEKQSHP